MECSPNCIFEMEYSTHLEKFLHFNAEVGEVSTRKLRSFRIFYITLNSHRMFFENNEINNLEKQKSIMPTTLTEAKKKSWPLWPCFKTVFLQLSKP